MNTIDEGSISSPAFQPFYFKERTNIKQGSRLTKDGTVAFTVNSWYGFTQQKRSKRINYCYVMLIQALFRRSCVYVFINTFSFQGRIE